MPDHGSVDQGKRSTFLYPFVKGVVGKGKKKPGVDMPWKDVIVPKYIIQFIAEKKSQGTKPSVRGIAYMLETKRIVPKNDHTYARIKRVLSDARRGYKRRDGTRGPPTIPMDAFADNTRHIIKDFEDEERSLKAYINDGIVHLEKLPDGFKSLVPRWLDQKNYVEVWVEKDSKAQDVRKALKGRHVVIAPNRGTTSITFIHQNIERVVDQFIEHNREKVYILYLGDLDPFGWDMDRLAKEDLARQTRGLMGNDGKPAGPRFVFKRIGVTEEQIKKFKFEHLKHPDPETLKKLMSKRNLAERFRKRFGSIFQIELEAFDLIPFSKFQKLITDEVDKLYYDDVHEEVLERPEYSQEPRVIKDQIIEALNDLIVRLSKEEEE